MHKSDLPYLTQERLDYFFNAVYDADAALQGTIMNYDEGIKTKVLIQEISIRYINREFL